ncbi:hypothetical protein D5018_05500 [Parashewanella curva]|uniref:Uncharacterized protein n=1 Tax=Parashewanella curva TaxID=2338552 RepID=A0A3L8Q0Z1_9GAMM|nr:hypothetical protein [Parashewanella curva]RLV60729.1 hypothetical protein D5018_05500 [Parashewanella curva]
MAESVVSSRPTVTLRTVWNEGKPFQLSDEDYSALSAVVPARKKGEETESEPVEATLTYSYTYTAKKLGVFNTHKTQTYTGDVLLKRDEISEAIIEFLNKTSVEDQHNAYLAKVQKQFQIRDRIGVLLSVAQQAVIRQREFDEKKSTRRIYYDAHDGSGQLLTIHQKTADEAKKNRWKWKK